MDNDNVLRDWNTVAENKFQFQLLKLDLLEWLVLLEVDEAGGLLASRNCCSALALALVTVALLCSRATVLLYTDVDTCTAHSLTLLYFNIVLFEYKFLYTGFTRLFNMHS